MLSSPDQNLSTVLVAHGGEDLSFSNEYACTSPCAAAAVVFGRAANWRTSWVVEGSGQTYAAWQDSQLNSRVSGASSPSSDD